ncbi:MAG: hypothetical protein KGI46_09230 [Alphaproteobacteria bacterium]|nr:hypothetical protein [Alphaproteobacteria bacterium]
MDTIRDDVSMRLLTVPHDFGSPALPDDDIEIARQRMRHLAPWNVEPLPLMHSVDGAPMPPPSADVRERRRQLALQILAVQMWHAKATSALQ